MEEFNAKGCGNSNADLRRSSRVNKGVPPKRFDEHDEADLKMKVNSTGKANTNTMMKTFKSDADLIHSVNDLPKNECPLVQSHRRNTRSDIVLPLSRQFSRSVLMNEKAVQPKTSCSSRKNETISSRKSSISKINLELKLIQQQKVFDEEEVQEKLKAIERRRYNAMREIELQKKLIETSNESSELESISSQNMYQDTNFMNCWLENAEKCIQIKEGDADNGEITSYTFENKLKTKKSDEYHLSSERYNIQSDFGGGGERDTVFDIAKRCIENTANTNKLLLRQKVRDLIHFSGELTDWPIFYSEFKRSTEQYDLTDDDNLVRLDRALRGKARETVKALLISPDNVPRILKMLEMNFGRPEWIVLSLMDKVKKIGYVREDRLESCISFSNALSNMVVTMKNVNSSLYLFNPELLSNLVEKLPPIQKYNWGKVKYQKDIQGIPTSLEDFSIWYEEEVNSMASTSNPFQKSKNFAKRESVMVSKKSIQNEENPNNCVFCMKPDHMIEKCHAFIEKSVSERRDEVQKLKLCFLCLRGGHFANKCFLKSRCGVNNCKGRHSKLLHVPRECESVGDQHSTNSLNPSSNEFCAKVDNGERSALLRIAPVLIRGPVGEIKTFALFDEGSTCSMIDNSLADKLNLHGTVAPLCFQWTNGITHFEDTSRKVSMNISADTKKPTFYRMENVRTVGNLSLPNQRVDVERLCRSYPYLDRHVLKAVENAKPEILIGQDNCGLIIPRQVIQPRINHPIMSKSKLGWTIHGAVNGSSRYDENVHANLCCRNTSDEDLHLLVKESFKLEAFGLKVNEKTIISAEDRRALEIMDKTIRKVGNRYEVGHLWRSETVILPESKPNALKRLICMERKMNHDPEFAKQYREKIQDYINKGYARKLEANEIMKHPKSWYLPHFAVWNINKPGKIRLVFDAAAKSHGCSLNDYLLQGPDFVPSLVSVLWRFRQGKIAFSGDAREMFHQVLIRKEDRCSQRFLWREEENIGGNPDVYEMNVMVFGIVSSPFVAQYIKNKNAESFELEFPGITRAMKQQHYVDDYLDSCSTEEAAIRRVREVIHVHGKAGFEMVKWISNSRAVLDSIPECLRANPENNMKIDSQNLERTLGLSWSPQTDHFTFPLSFHKIPIEISSGTKIPTKREVLRIIMSVFDPIGFLAPLIIKARILMQNIWRSRIDWDSDIPEGLVMTWQKWLQELQELSPIKVNRCYFPNLPSVEKVDLHMFCDASDKAYSSVAYFRTRSSYDNEIYTSFVTAKFKIAPINQQTIPKLELQGAILACRLSRTICSQLEYKIEEIHFWTDSMVVLKQIRSESTRFPMFVSCRVGEIHECTDLSQWHWVPSELNVADQATKELKTLNLHLNGSWFCGPSFLRHPKEFWPTEPKCTNDEADDQLIFLVDDHTRTNIMDLPDIMRFSKLNRLIRATAWILHFRKVISKPKNERPKTLFLEIEVLEEAYTMWTRKSQHDYFDEEIRLLEKEKPITKNSRIYKLSPFLGHDGIIRLKGRFPEIDGLGLDYHSRNPAILDPKHRFTELLIHHYHQQVGHVGIETVVNNLRVEYWILHVRAAVKKCFNSCQICKIRKCQPIPPEMGMLPAQRLESFVFPFSYVGIDFFGPMTVSIGRRIEKRYGVLFTCLTIRAVHIEIAASLDTSSTILAIRRFMSRRGQPKQFITDNGTNFVGAERELREWVQSLDQTKILDELTSKGVCWKFNSPAAPHMGGIWERMVRSIKTALKITLKSINPKEEVLSTLLSEAEYTVNSRPLTHISVDPYEPEAITPNHFLLLRPGGIRSYHENEILNTSSRKQWRIAEALANSYWRRWVLEYRPTLIQRQKWHSKSSPIQVGDVVVIVDEKAPRNEWLMGRVEEVYPGKDGTARVAKIKTKRGHFTRPVVKLCILQTIDH